MPTPDESSTKRPARLSRGRADVSCLDPHWSGSDGIRFCAGVIFGVFLRQVQLLQPNLAASIVRLFPRGLGWRWWSARRCG